MATSWTTLYQWRRPIIHVTAGHVMPKIKGTGCEALPRWMEGTQDVLWDQRRYRYRWDDGGWCIKVSPASCEWKVSEIWRFDTQLFCWSHAVLVKGRVSLKDGEWWVLTNLFEQKLKQGNSQYRPQLGKVGGWIDQNCMTSNFTTRANSKFEVWQSEIEGWKLKH